MFSAACRFEYRPFRAFERRITPQCYALTATRSAWLRSVQRSSTASIPTLNRRSGGGRCPCPGTLARRSIVDSTAPRLVAC